MILSPLESRTTPYDDLYPTCERAGAWLFIYPGKLDPDFVSAKLGLVPTEAVRKGQTSANSLGRTRTGQLNGWFLSSEDAVSSRDLRRHLDWLLVQLAPRATQLNELQNLAGVSMRVNCIWWSAHGHGGPALWPEQMSKLAELGLECAFDLYFLAEEETE